MSITCPCCGVALELALVRPRKESIPDWLRRQVFERDDWACVQCSATKDLTCDHIFPEMYGGEATLDNLQTLCRSCNSRKGSNLPDPTANLPLTTAILNGNGEVLPDAGKVLDLDSETDPKPHRRKNTYNNPHFQRFWRVYPLRKEKYAAYRAFMRFVVDAGVDVDAVIAAAAAYRDDPHRDPNYTKYPQGWLSAGRWEDEANADAAPVPVDDRYKPVDTEARMAELEALAKEWEDV